MDFEYPGLSVQGTNLEATNGHIRLIYRPNRTKYSPAPVEEVQYIYNILYTIVSSFTITYSLYQTILYTYFIRYILA